MMLTGAETVEQALREANKVEEGLSLGV